MRYNVIFMLERTILITTVVDDDGVEEADIIAAGEELLRQDGIMHRNFMSIEVEELED